MIKMKARYPSNCKECGEPLIVGEDIYYDVNEQKAYCVPCGEDLKDG